jgi:hypothetical protein
MNHFCNLDHLDWIIKDNDLKDVFFLGQVKEMTAILPSEIPPQALLEAPDPLLNKNLYQE